MAITKEQIIEIKEIIKESAEDETSRDILSYFKNDELGYDAALEEFYSYEYLNDGNLQRKIEPILKEAAISEPQTKKKVLKTAIELLLGKINENDLAEKVPQIIGISEEEKEKERMYERLAERGNSDLGIPRDVLEERNKDTGDFYYSWWVFTKQEFETVKDDHVYPRDRGERNSKVEELINKNVILGENLAGQRTKGKVHGIFTGAFGLTKRWDKITKSVPAFAGGESQVLALGIAKVKEGLTTKEIYNFDVEKLVWKWDYWRGDGGGQTPSNKKLIILTGEVKDFTDSKEGILVPGAEIAIFHAHEGKITKGKFQEGESFRTNDGKFRFKMDIPLGKGFVVGAKKEGYEPTGHGEGRDVNQFDGFSLHWNDHGYPHGPFSPTQDRFDDIIVPLKRKEGSKQPEETSETIPEKPEDFTKIDDDFKESRKKQAKLENEVMENLLVEILKLQELYPEASLFWDRNDKREELQNIVELLENIKRNAPEMGNETVKIIQKTEGLINSMLDTIQNNKPDIYHTTMEGLLTMLKDELIPQLKEDKKKLEEKPQPEELRQASEAQEGEKKEPTQKSRNWWQTSLYEELVRINIINKSFSQIIGNDEELDTLIKELYESLTKGFNYFKECESKDLESLIKWYRGGEFKSVIEKYKTLVQKIQSKKDASPDLFKESVKEYQKGITKYNSNKYGIRILKKPKIEDLPQII